MSCARVPIVRLGEKGNSKFSILVDVNSAQPRADIVLLISVDEATIVDGEVVDDVVVEGFEVVSPKQVVRKSEQHPKSVFPMQVLSQ